MNKGTRKNGSFVFVIAHYVFTTKTVSGRVITLKIAEGGQHERKSSFDLLGVLVQKLCDDSE